MGGSDGFILYEMNWNDVTSIVASMGDRLIMWYKPHFEAFELGAVSTSVLRRQVLVEASDLNAVQFCRKELKNQEVQDDEMQVRKRWGNLFSGKIGMFISCWFNMWYCRWTWGDWLVRIFFAAGCADKGWLPSSNAVQVGATAQRYTKLLLWVVFFGSYFHLNFLWMTFLLLTLWGLFV